jgi:hypothetical protein
MARRFPHVSVLGIDLSPHTPNPDIDPPNAQFQVYDINHGMEQFYGQFDVVQMRCVSGGIKSIDKTVDEVLQSLKPGGFVTIIDGDRSVNEDRSRYLEIMEVEGDEGSNASISKNGSWFERVWFGMFCAYSTIDFDRCIEHRCAQKISGIDLKPNYKLLEYHIWDQDLCDPETVKSGSILIPVGPWATGQTSPFISLAISSHPIPNRSKPGQGPKAPSSRHTNAECVA